MKWIWILSLTAQAGLNQRVLLIVMFLCLPMRSVVLAAQDVDGVAIRPRLTSEKRRKSEIKKFFANPLSGLNKLLGCGVVSARIPRVAA